MRKSVIFLLMVTFGYICFGESIKIYVPKAPPAIPFMKAGDSVQNDEIVLYTDINSEVLPKILKREEGLYVVPSNVASKLYNKKVDIVLLGVISTGLLHVISCDEEVKSLKDLSSKEVYIGDKGSSPDIVSRYIFDKKGVKPDIVYSSSFEIARFMIAGKIKNCVLPEPLASIIVHQMETKGKFVRRIADMKNEWNSINNTNGIPQTAIIVTKGLYNTKRKEVNQITQNYKKSVEWVNKYPKEAAVIGKKIMESDVPEVVIEKSIPNMNLVFISGKEAAEGLTTYFNMLNSYDGSTIGGKIPDGEFFGE